jgi:hypothetical protein
MAAPLKIGLVGFGKIAADQHVPAIAAFGERGGGLREPCGRGTPDGLRHLALALQRGGRGRSPAPRAGENRRASRHLERGRPPLASGPGLGVGARWVWRLRSRHQRALDPHRHRAPAAGARGARIEVPRNRETPIAARLDLRLSDSEARISAEFDWRQTGDQSWDIDIRTRSGTRLNLSKGGSVLSVDGKVVVEEPPASTRASTSGSRP